MFAGGDTNLMGYVFSDPVNGIDPSGTTCEYSQSSGRMTCTNASGTYFDQTGYSGTGGGRNSPSMQSAANLGPIPQGTYTTSAPYLSSHTGPNTISLTPDLATNFSITMMGRDPNSFKMHGNNSSNDASHGCMILSPDRTLIPAGETVNVGP